MSENGVRPALCSKKAISSVVTLRFLPAEFHGLEEMMLLRSLQALQTDGKAEIFSMDDGKGVKFFWKRCWDHTLWLGALISHLNRHILKARLGARPGRRWLFNCCCCLRGSEPTLSGREPLQSEVTLCLSTGNVCCHLKHAMSIRGLNNITFESYRELHYLKCN